MEATSPPLRAHAARARRPSGAALLRSCGFAALFLAAVWLGRQTVMDGTSLSLVWPAAGVAVVWFAAQREAGTRALDLSLLSVATYAVNAMTGAPALLATCFVGANVVQVLLLHHVLARLRPHLWGFGGKQQLSTVGDLWALLGAAVLATAVGGTLGPLAAGMVTGQWSAVTTAVWMTRNTASVLLIGLAGLRLGATLTARRAGGTAADTRLWSGAARGPEVVLLVAGSVVAHGLTFGVADGLPLAFTLIVLTVWVGARFDTTFAALHDLVVAVAAVLLTLQGSGPFAAVESDALRALVVQAFIVVTAVTGLSLGLMRDERDALLRRVQDAARRDGEQAALLSAIVDTLHEGLLALDVDGRVVVRNAAARHLLGAAVEDPERLADPSSYGLSHLDGRPLTRHESAVSRALSGERVDGERVLVGAEGTPERRVLDVNAAPLPTAGEGHGAVVVFHDVTAQHAQQADLAAFAGVVAHDLRTPLTALDGWVELAEDTVHDDLPPGPAQEALAAALARARGSSRRMRTLIEDLLADATARDTAARRARVRTAALVAEVIAARGGPPRDDSPAPRFHVGQLPDVLADPVLLRQVLDNLVGNAVKYVAPGSVPDVTVTGRALPADRVELTVADRGIGIPAGQHEAVFGEFHRAHAGAGYAGTGIGLALCRRIVERHGGTITAQPNPGGGTCVSVVLPAPSAARSAPAAGRQAPAGSRR